MKSDTIKYAIGNLLHRKMRSWLTVLSILIGIMAIFALVSFGVGVQQYVNTLGEEMGSNKLIVQPRGFAPAGSSTIVFTDKDINAMKSVIGIDTVAPVIMTQAEIRQNKDKQGKWNYIAGQPTVGKQANLIKETWGLDFDSGRALRSQDKYKAVLGYNYKVPDKIFSKPVKLRDTIYIKDTEFKVVGFYEEVGNPQDDANVYIPLDTAKEVFNQNTYTMVLASVSSGVTPSDMVSKVEKALRKERGLDKGKEDFTVQTFEDMIATFNNILGVLNGVLVLIALISVVVSAVNIANAMYTAVLERTNEIGVMKAIGAKNNVILSVFLIESGLLGLAGGTIGIILGWLIAKGGGSIAASAGYSALQPAFPWWLILGCLAFSFLVGMFSGTFPAKQASKLRPVDALRYE